MTDFVFSKRERSRSSVFSVARAYTRVIGKSKLRKGRFKGGNLE